MANCMQARSQVTIGLDLGDDYSHFFVLDAEGECTGRGRVKTTPPAFRKHFGALSSTLVVIEVGTHSPWVSEVLEECGHEVLIANPRQLRLIFASDKKSDKTDPENLARVARMDRSLLRPLKHRGRKARLALSLVRARDAAVKARTALVNHIKGAVKQYGERIRGTTARNCHSKAAESLPDDLLEIEKPLLELLENFSTTIKLYDKRIEALGEEYPETQRLRQIRGVGPLTALAFVLIIEDPSRFKKSRDVGAYLGLVPRRSQSGEQDPQLRITKAGDPFLRGLLVQSAHYILGPFGRDCDLRRHGEKIAARGGKNAKKRAVIAVARKLSVLLHRLWVTKGTYWPVREARFMAQAEVSAATTATTST